MIVLFKVQLNLWLEHINFVAIFFYQQYKFNNKFDERLEKLLWSMLLDDWVFAKRNRIVRNKRETIKKTESYFDWKFKRWGGQIKRHRLEGKIWRRSKEVSPVGEKDDVENFDR